MQMVKNILIAFLLLWFALLLFMPKKALYYKLEEVLAKSEVMINENSIEEGLFSLTIKEAKVFVKGIEIARLEKIDIFTILFYTKCQFSSLKIDESLKEMTPTNIESINLIHSALSPLDVGLDASGVFGDVRGNADLKKRTVRIDFEDTSALKGLEAKLQQDEKGWYYEASF